jgi:hypothetical protein
MKTRTRVLLYLIIFALVDVVIPVPITALLLIYVLFEKPDWFRDLVSEIYSS